MKYIFALCILFICKAHFYGQKTQIDTLVTYRLSMLQNCNPDTIYALDLSKSKLKAVPEELKAFVHLKALDLSKNDLSDLPSWLGDFKDLQVLNLAKNEFLVFPVEICRLEALEELIFNRNYVDRLPDCIGYCKKIERFDFWDTPIMHFPETFFQLNNLKSIDLQGIKYSPDFQDKLKSRLPNAKILFDAPCDCLK